MAAIFRLSDVAIETYACDATGHRTRLATAAGTTGYTYPAVSRRLLAVDGEVRNHDPAGSTVSMGGKEFQLHRCQPHERGDAGRGCC